MLNDFINSNYCHASWNRKIGVHYYHTRNKRTSVNCFVVRVPNSRAPHVRTIGKYTTKQAAEKAFIDNTPNWHGAIPYYETFGDKGFKSYK